jgi:hypothetical protein
LPMLAGNGSNRTRLAPRIEHFAWPADGQRARL